MRIRPTTSHPERAEVQSEEPGRHMIASLWCYCCSCYILVCLHVVKNCFVHLPAFIDEPFQVRFAMFLTFLYFNIFIAYAVVVIVATKLNSCDLPTINGQ